MKLYCLASFLTLLVRKKGEGHFSFIAKISIVAFILYYPWLCSATDKFSRILIMTLVCTDISYDQLICLISDYFLWFLSLDPSSETFQQFKCICVNLLPSQFVRLISYRVASNPLTYNTLSTFLQLCFIYFEWKTKWANFCSAFGD